MARMDKSEMAEFFVRELETGIGDTGIRCGFIGEIGINEGFPEGDRRSLAAAAIAQRQTGAAHPHPPAGAGALGGRDVPHH